MNKMVREAWGVVVAGDLLGSCRPSRPWMSGWSLETEERDGWERDGDWRRSILRTMRMGRRTSVVQRHTGDVQRMRSRGSDSAAKRSSRIVTVVTPTWLDTQ